MPGQPLQPVPCLLTGMTSQGRCAVQVVWTAGEKSLVLWHVFTGACLGALQRDSQEGERELDPTLGSFRRAEVEVDRRTPHIDAAKACPALRRAASMLPTQLQLLRPNRGWLQAIVGHRDVSPLGKGGAALAGGPPPKFPC